MAQPGFPTAPSFTTEALQPPPALRPDIPVEDQIKEIHNFLNSQWVSLNSMQTSIESGWLIDTVRILNLEASTITSGSIFTQDLYIGEDQLITLSGLTNRIEVKDKNGQIRTRIGSLGAGATNWGQEWWDSSGTLIMSVGDTVFINGAVISNATIDASSKIIDNTVTDGKINTMGAAKLTGTLTLDGNPACVVTSSGALTFNSGGDIIMLASGTDFSFIKFRTSANADRANLSYNATFNRFFINTVNSADISIVSDDQFFVAAGSLISLTSTTTCTIGAGTNLTLQAGGTITLDDATVVNGNMSTHAILPAADNTYVCGNVGARWALVRGTVITPGDLVFENDVIITEPDKVYRDADPHDGLCFLNKNWEMMGWWHKNGTLEIAGEIKEKVRFKKPHYKYKEAHERVH